mgnify:CR=1 FL=1
MIYLLAMVGIIFSSCEEKIDGTSEESMKGSIKKIKSSLLDDEKEKFEESLKLITFQGLDFGDLIKEGSAEKTANALRDKLDGMTADEVIAKGEKIKAEIEKKKKEQAKQEIKELYENKDLANKNKKKLKQFEIKSSKFYKREKRFGSDQPIIELTVKNRSNNALSKAYFKGTLASPERSVPWLQDEFNYEISGGLEPGEETTWKLAPNMFSEWGEVEAPKDAVLTVEVLRLDGPDGEKLYSVDNFDEDDRERLKELLRDYPEFERE